MDQPGDGREIRSGLADLAGWGRLDDEIEKVYELRSFPDAIAFVTGRICDQLGVEHHLLERWGSDA